MMMRPCAILSARVTALLLRGRYLIFKGSAAERGTGGPPRVLGLV
jgi:hypothetical protein